MGKGLFITFEGVEGSGKSTQIELLRDALEKAGRKTLATRSPGGTPVAEAIRNILKHKRTDEELMPETELLLFAACHSQSMKWLLGPALERGEIVLCDRFFDSTTAYQGCARGLSFDFVRKINEFSCRGLKPDLTILLDLPPESGTKRAIARAGAAAVNADRFDSEAMHFHEKVREGFLLLAKADPERFRIFDATLPIEALHNSIAETLRNEFGIL